MVTPPPSSHTPIRMSAQKSTGFACLSPQRSDQCLAYKTFLLVVLRTNIIGVRGGGQASTQKSQLLFQPALHVQNRALALRPRLSEGKEIASGPTPSRGCQGDHCHNISGAGGTS